MRLCRSFAKVFAAWLLAVPCFAQAAPPVTAIVGATVIANLSRIHRVMKGGVVFDPVELMRSVAASP